MKINIQHNTKQWYHNAFSGPKLENKKNDEQLKHRNIIFLVLCFSPVKLFESIRRFDHYTAVIISDLQI